MTKRRDHLYPIDTSGDPSFRWQCPVCPGGGDGFVMTLWQKRRNANGTFAKHPTDVCARCWRNGIRTVAE